MATRWYLVLLLLMPTVVSAQTVLDRVVAVVDNEVILESELNAQVQFYVLNNRLDATTPGVKEQVLQSMIAEKLILAKAIEDSIVVTDDEVQQQLDRVIQQRIQQFGSESRLEEMYGMPISRIRREFRDEMRKQLLTQRMQQERFGMTDVGRREVEEFFLAYRDSLPRVPEEAELAHIFIRPKASVDDRVAARKRLMQIRDSIVAGGDFADFARRYSEDAGSAAQGGDLGLVRRGLFVREFESAVFSLGVGELSYAVETPFGVHLIQLLERRGDAVRARHILLRVAVSDAEADSTIALLSRIRKRVLAGESFAELARKYSDDEDTKLVGGVLGSFELDQLPKELSTTVSPLAEGEISEPAQLTAGNVTGYHIVWMKRRTPAHAMTLETDYQRISTIALSAKRMREYERWIEELKGSIYWQIRI